MKTYAKFIAQVVAAGLTALVLALSDDRVDTSEWINVVIAVLGAVGVVVAGETLTGAWSYAKTWVSAATVGAIFLQSAITDGVAGSEWVQLIIVVLGALGVAVAPGPKVETVGRHAA